MCSIPIAEVSYKAISSCMYKLSDYPRITTGISFE